MGASFPGRCRAGPGIMLHFVTHIIAENAQNAHSAKMGRCYNFKSHFVTHFVTGPKTRKPLKHKGSRRADMIEKRYVTVLQKNTYTPGSFSCDAAMKKSFRRGVSIFFRNNRNKRNSAGKPRKINASGCYSFDGGVTKRGKTVTSGSEAQGRLAGERSKNNRTIIHQYKPARFQNDIKRIFVLCIIEKSIAFAG